MSRSHAPHSRGPAIRTRRVAAIRLACPAPAGGARPGHRAVRAEQTRVEHAHMGHIRQVCRLCCAEMVGSHRPNGHARNHCGVPPCSDAFTEGRRGHHSGKNYHFSRCRRIRRFRPQVDCRRWRTPTPHRLTVYRPVTLPGVPTFELTERFWDDWHRLTPAQQERFLRARDLFASNLIAGRGFQNSLRVKGVQGSSGVYEMTWADDGRATFSYGRSNQRGAPHIIWRRVGTHEIFGCP